MPTGQCLISAISFFREIVSVITSHFLICCEGKLPVWRIRDVYPGSDFFPSRIPDPNCLNPGSRILIKEFKYSNPKKAKKWFLSSKKYPGCSSRIRMLTFSHPGSRIQGSNGTQSRIPDPDPQHWKLHLDPHTVSRKEAQCGSESVFGTGCFYPDLSAHLFKQKCLIVPSFYQ
jgi:hypothetical protein